MSGRHFRLRRGPDPGALDAPLRRVLEAIESGAPLGEATSEAGLTAAQVRGALGRLELMGLVRRDGFGRYERAASTAP